jgi:hypothetical protein
MMFFLLSKTKGPRFLLSLQNDPFLTFSFKPLFSFQDFLLWPGGPVYSLRQRV